MVAAAARCLDVGSLGTLCRWASNRDLGILPTIVWRPLRLRANRLTFQPSRRVLQKHTPVPHQLLPLQILLGKHLTALHSHDRLAVCLCVDLIETHFLFVTGHFAVHSSDHTLHQVQGLSQVFLLLFVVLKGKHISVFQA